MLSPLVWKTPEREGGTLAPFFYSELPTSSSVRSQIRRLRSPKELQDSGKHEEPSHGAANHRHSSRPLPQLVASESLERWKRPRKRALCWAHALSSSDSSKIPSWDDKLLETESRLPLGDLLPSLVRTQPFFGPRSENNFPGQHRSKSWSLPNPL